MKKSVTPMPCVDDMTPPVSEPLHTTLYDLIAALQESVEPHEDMAAVTATAMHMLNTYRVTCTGDLQGYRMIGEAEPTRRRQSASSSRFEKTAVSF